MKKDKIFAFIKEPSEMAIRLIDKDLKAFNSIIEGKREIIPFPEMPGVCIIIDGNAAVNKKEPSCFLPEYDDLLLGTVIFIGIDIETGFVSLTEEQAETIEEYLKANNASGFMGDIETHVNKEYLSNSDENAVYSFLSETKTKYKNIKVKWLQKK